MSTISVKRAGFALGGACGLFYLGCVVLMLAVPESAVIWFFNSILHGWDVRPIMRGGVPWWEAIIGAAETFILGGVFGALLAVLYNIGANPKRPQ